MNAAIEKVNEKSTSLVEEAISRHAKYLDRVQHATTDVNTMLERAGRGELIVVEPIVAENYSNLFGFEIGPQIRVAAETSGWMHIAVEVANPMATLPHELRKRWRGGNWGQVVRRFLEVKVPRIARSHQLAAPLLLIANEAVTDQGNEPLGVCITPRTWTFYFFGTQGQQLFDAWAKQCVTDPVFRAVRHTL